MKTAARPAAPAPVPSQPAPQPELAEIPAPAAPVPSSTPPPTVVVELSLKKLWTKLNPEIVRLATGHPNGTASLRLPLPLLQAQLAKGSVKLPLVQFRQFSPAGLFPQNPEKDAIEVEIPISDIIPLLKPEHFARRPNQRKIEVPDDIGMVFGPGAAMFNGMRVSEQKARAAAPNAGHNGAHAALAADRELASIPSPFKKVAAEPTPVLPVPEAKIPTPKLAPPAPVPVPSITPPAEAIAAPALPKVPAAKAEPIAVTPAPVLEPIAPPIPQPLPISPLAPSPEPVLPVLNTAPIPAPKLDPSLASLRPPAPSKANAPKTPEGNFTLPLMDVAAFWSEKGRNDLGNLYRHTLDIPMSTLENALKSGKLQFQWREVRPWLRLAPGNGMPNLSDDLLLEFPLSVIAPRFIEMRGHRQKTEVDLGDIPDVFEQKHPVQNGASSAPPLGATAVPMENAAALQSSGKTGDTAFLTRTAGKPVLEFGEIFGQPEKKNWTMSEIAQKTLSLRGIAGAIIGTSDGLLVAGNWPGGPRSDAVAAFVPQMYNKILQYSKELKIGEPSSFMLMVDNVPLQVFKAGQSYFTVIGRPGENLPKAQLNAVAMRLGTTHK